MRLSIFNAVFIATFVVAVNGGNFDADCVGGWTKKTDKLDPNTPSDLSSCQLSSLGFEDGNDILLGGEGSSSAIGVGLGSGGDGCDGANECMEQCQALCCIAKNCVYAEIKRIEIHHAKSVVTSIKRRKSIFTVAYTVQGAGGTPTLRPTAT
jgi:hypothetical protein